MINKFVEAQKLLEILLEMLPNDDAKTQLQKLIEIIKIEIGL